MENDIKDAVEEYQCSGCCVGMNTKCFENDVDFGVGCSIHRSGTMITHIGSIFLGMPTGFNRLGSERDLKPNIYKTFDGSEFGGYNKFNVPVWKHLNENGHTIVRGISPRINLTFIHIYLKDCLDKINCLEITQADIDEMD